MNQHLIELEELILFYKHVDEFKNKGVFTSFERLVGKKKITISLGDVDKLVVMVIDKINDVLDLFDDNLLTESEINELSKLYYYWYGQSLEEYVNERSD